MSALAWLLRLGIAGMFGWAAVIKIRDPAAFFSALGTYHLLPAEAAAIVSLWLPWAELVGAAAIFWPRHRAGALWALQLLTVAFCAVLGQAWLRGLDINCGCFGGSASVRGAAYLAYLGRDFLLGGAIALLLWLEGRPRMVPVDSGRTIPLPAAES